jgi:hypothetical protein
VWAAAALVVAIAIGVGLYFAFADEPEPVVEATPTTVAPEPTPTTAAPEAETATDLETIEAGVAAFYSGDGEKAAELFELSDRTDEQIREEAAYQAAIGGRLTLNCTGGEDGVFQCTVPYQNAMTDALGSVDHGDTNRVVVEDGVITEFGFPEHSWMVLSMGAFLAIEGRFDGYEDCGFGPFPASCAAIQLENLDAFVEWRKTALEPAQLVEATLASWYGGDCGQATFLSGTEFNDVYSADDCASGPTQPPTSPIRMMDYESILGAEVSVDSCETLSTGDAIDVTCEVHYSNAMSQAVGRPPAVTVREFSILVDAILTDIGGEQAWYKVNYPEDVELRDSFRSFADSGDLADEYTEAGCATDRTENCANLIMENIDDWAAWYEANS